MLRYALMFCAAIFATNVQAADLPDRPIRIIVPFTPAGTSDILARVLAETGGNVAEAARRAGVDRGTVFRTLRRTGMREGEG